MALLEELNRLRQLAGMSPITEEELAEKQWSGSVHTHWPPPEGFFSKSADDIAHGLKSRSDSLKQAMGRLNFYINRAGSNLSATEKSKLEAAKTKLHSLYD